MPPYLPFAEIMSKAAFYNEMLRDDGNPRRHYGAYAQWLAAATSERLAAKRLEADALFHRLGITFAVYGEENGPERLMFEKSAQSVATLVDACKTIAPNLGRGK